MKEATMPGMAQALAFWHNSFFSCHSSMRSDLPLVLSFGHLSALAAVHHLWEIRGIGSDVPSYLGVQSAVHKTPRQNPASKFKFTYSLRVLYREYMQ